MKKWMIPVVCILLSAFLYGCGCDNAADPSVPETNEAGQTTEGTTDAAQQDQEWEAEIDIGPEASQSEEQENAGSDSAAEATTGGANGGTSSGANGGTNSGTSGDAVSPSENDDEDDASPSQGTTEPNTKENSGDGRIELPRIPAK